MATKKATFSPITKDKLEGQKGEFRAQLPDVNPVRWAIDYGFLRSRWPEEADELRAGGSLALLLGNDAFRDVPMVGLIPLVNQKLARRENREHYLRFILKYLRPCALAAARVYFAERGEDMKVQLIDLAAPFLADPQRPENWKDNSNTCKDWMGHVVEQIEAQVGGELRTHL